MTRQSLRRLEDRLPPLENQQSDYEVQDFWQRSAAGENPLDDPEYAERFARSVEEHGWPEQWSE
jgi:hypothetical protein